MGVRQDLIDRTSYSTTPRGENTEGVLGTAGPPDGIVQGQKATAELHRDAYETTDKTTGEARPSTNVRRDETVRHEVDHLQQYDQMQTQAAKGGPMEKFN